MLLFNFIKTLIFLLIINILTLFTLYAEDNVLKNADLGYGEYLSGECVTCHHKEGLDKGIPSITGWEADVFANVMIAYKNKEIENPVMQLVAGRLDKEQIASLALYFSSLPSLE